MILVGSFHNLNASEVAGKIVSASGKVFLETANQKNPKKVSKLLASGNEVHAGDSIRTDPQAEARFLMTDHTVIDIAGGSLFRIDGYQLKNLSDREVAVSLDYGKVRASVNEKLKGRGKFNFRTQGASMGVRGTEFVVAVDQSKQGQENHVNTAITVVHGEVTIASGTSAPISMGAGKQLTTRATVTPAPPSTGGSASGAAAAVVVQSKAEVKSLSTGEMTRVTQEARVEDHTFAQAVTVEASPANGNSGSSPNAALSNVAAAQQTAPPPPAASSAAPPPSIPGGQATLVTAAPVIILPRGSLINAKVVFRK